MVTVLRIKHATASNKRKFAKKWSCPNLSDNSLAYEIERPLIDEKTLYLARATYWARVRNKVKDISEWIK